MSKPIEFKADTTCDSCGRFGAFDLGDEYLCSDCYSERGSCCLEFGGYDLWKDEKRTLNRKKNKTLNKSNSFHSIIHTFTHSQS